MTRPTLRRQLEQWRSAERQEPRGRRDQERGDDQAPVAVTGGRVRVRVVVPGGGALATSAKTQDQMRLRASFRDWTPVVGNSGSAKAQARAR
jgi:hypothetical protein